MDTARADRIEVALRITGIAIIVLGWLLSVFGANVDSMLAAYAQGNNPMGASALSSIYSILGPVLTTVNGVVLIAASLVIRALKPHVWPSGDQRDS